VFDRGIGEQEVRETLERGETIEHYPHDTPHPSRLVLGWSGHRPIHVVAADSRHEDEIIDIAVYEPDPALWEADFRRRKR